MALQNKAAFDAALTTYLPDNTTQLISPLDHRTVETNMSDSVGWLSDDNVFTGSNSFQGHLKLSVNVFTGTTETFAADTFQIFSGGTACVATLPALTGLTDKLYKGRNRSAVNLTIQRAGSDQIYGGSGLVTSFVVYPGESFEIINDGTYWVTL